LGFILISKSTTTVFFGPYRVQERLNALALIALESGMLEKTDYEYIIEDFISKDAKEYRFSHDGYTIGIILGLHYYT